MAGGLLALSALVFLNLAVVTMPIRNRFDRFDVGVICTLLGMLTITVLPINLLSVFAALRGIFTARRRGKPVAYGVLGLVLSGLSFGLWVCAGVAGFAVLLGA